MTGLEVGFPYMQWILQQIVVVMAYAFVTFIVLSALSVVAFAFNETYKLIKHTLFDTK